MSAAQGGGEEANADEVLGRHGLERDVGEQTALRHAGVRSDFTDRAAIDDQKKRSTRLASDLAGRFVVAVPEGVACVVRPAAMDFGRDVAHDLAFFRATDIGPEQKCYASE